jgi:hypothetical protein
MTESQVILAFKEVARRLDESGVAWAVFAGAAATAYGVVRSLTDIDILVPTVEGDRVATLFPEARVVYRRDGRADEIKMPGYDILAGLDVVDLDDQMAARLTRHEIAGVTVPVVSPEDNIFFKALLGRGPEVGKHDWEDVRAMLSHLPTLDWEYLRWRAGTCSAGERAQQALERLANEAKALRPGLGDEGIFPG